jgi:hypothetical protein
VWLELMTTWEQENVAFFESLKTGGTVRSEKISNATLRLIRKRYFSKLMLSGVEPHWFQ